MASRLARGRITKASARLEALLRVIARLCCITVGSLAAAGRRLFLPGGPAATRLLGRVCHRTDGSHGDGGACAVVARSCEKSTARSARRRPPTGRRRSWSKHPPIPVPSVRSLVLRCPCHQKNIRSEFAG